MLGLRTIDNTRPMEHSGKFRNIPEHSILKKKEALTAFCSVVKHAGSG